MASIQSIAECPPLPECQVMKATCRTCGVEFIPSERQLRKKDLQCDICWRAYKRDWYARRKAAGNPVLTTKMPRNWHRAYQKRYFQNQTNRLRRNAAAKRRYHLPCNHLQKCAHLQLRNALRRGVIERPARCDACGRNCTPHGHHPDYTEPLIVIWLCRICHQREHEKLAQSAKAEGRE